MKVQRFTVEGSGEFPFDMLRYDSCWPHTEQDSGLLTAEGKRQVQLDREVSSRRSVPTTARWESFNWRVIEVQTY
jgi:hypothetical protein